MLIVSAQEPAKTTSTSNAGAEVHKTDNDSSKKLHRAPMRKNITLSYDGECGILQVVCYGDIEGEVSLYYNGSLSGYEYGNTIFFPIAHSGRYEIEVIAESWIEYVQIEL